MSDEPFNYSGKLSFLYRACFDARLQRADLAVLAVMTEHANRFTGRCHPSVQRIVDTSGIPKTTALRSIRRLEDAGWIEAKRRNGAQSEYELTSPGDGTGSGGDTGAASGTGAKSNLQRGRTGATPGTDPVPVPGHEQRLFKSNKGGGATRAFDRSVKQQTHAPAATYVTPSPIQPERPKHERDIEWIRQQRDLLGTITAEEADRLISEIRAEHATQTTN